MEKYGDRIERAVWKPINEFVENDVLAEIGNAKVLWVVDKVASDGYFVSSFWDGRIHTLGSWMGFGLAHEQLVKVDEWDDVNKKMKNVEEI